EATAVENKLIKDKAYSIADNVTYPLLPPVAKEEVPYLDFSPLQNAVNELQKNADSLSSYMSNTSLTDAEKNLLNTKLYQAEQQLLTKDGLPRRGWYRHTIYAPGFYTGYGVKTLPGIREAIEQRNWKEAQEQISITANAINKFSAYLGSAIK
ncbi:MAG: transferrin receptor-like dimerization domain-containing protein, partial [Ferruginibacter sp.]